MSLVCKKTNTSIRRDILRCGELSKDCYNYFLGIQGAPKGYKEFSGSVPITSLLAFEASPRATSLYSLTSVFYYIRG